MKNYAKMNGFEIEVWKMTYSMYCAVHQKEPFVESNAADAADRAVQGLIPVIEEIQRGQNDG